jgi:hypothetical protein
MSDNNVKPFSPEELEALPETVRRLSEHSIYSPKYLLVDHLDFRRLLAAVSPRPAPAPETETLRACCEGLDSALDIAQRALQLLASETHLSDMTGGTEGERKGRLEYAARHARQALTDLLTFRERFTTRRPAPAGAPANECSTCHQSDAGPTNCSNPWHLLKAGYTMRDGVVTAPAAGADAGDVTDAEVEMATSIVIRGVYGSAERTRMRLALSDFLTHRRIVTTPATLDASSDVTCWCGHPKSKHGTAYVHGVLDTMCRIAKCQCTAFVAAPTDSAPSSAERREPSV